MKKKSKAGRPKMSRNAHLGIPDELTYEELKFLLQSIDEQFGLETAREIIRLFHVERLKDLPKSDYAKFFRVCRSRLNYQ